MPAILGMSFPGEVLKRGFWLYIWRIRVDDQREVHYIGRTGDSSSCHAQSPFMRVSAHLGPNEHSSALRKHMRNNKIEPTACRRFELFVYGPICKEASRTNEHKSRRNKVAALEKALCDAMTDAGYCVLNKVDCIHKPQPRLKEGMIKAFGDHFERLKN